MPSLPKTPRLRVLLALGWLTLTVAVAVGLPTRGPRGVPFTRLCYADDSTPDCGTPEVDPFPQRQRALHLARLGVERWHAAGAVGRGVKVAILDSGFRGYQAHLGKALPSQVTVRSFRADGNLEAKDSQHGILCGEVIHALAPEAEMLLANWDPDSPEQFLAAARWAREQGAKVISCSVIMPSWSDGEGGGPIHQALSRILGLGCDAADLLFFASAGNTARRHWSGPFHDRGLGLHEWTTGVTDNVLTPWNNERVSVELYWPAGAHYQLCVYDAQTGAEVGHSTARCDKNRCCGVVRFLPQASHQYRIRVRMVQGPSEKFHLVVLGGDLEHSTARGSIAFPADGPEVVAVGAVDRHGQRMAYSSCGPNSRRPKPDFVEPVPFPSLWRSRAFTGTSAAAPQAAALAALWWSRHPEWNADRVRQALRASAQDLGAPGHDCETGYGLITLPRREVRPVARTSVEGQRSLSTAAPASTR